MKYIGIFLVRFYQKYISPLKPPCCRFVPTCSQYAIEAFREWGFFIGFFLSVWRVLRCNPFCRGGYDPVPRRKRKQEEPASTNEKGETEQQ
ncbi:MAG: membrane protein insertion efficiency factor YidD [Clostridia bacterium]|nr:membrane protein insertion efficiency factor YidD [Clostridia bacterium]